MGFANQTHFDFVATEREMYNSMVPEAYDYVVSLRQSKARYYSHYLHLLRKSKSDHDLSKSDSLWLWNGPGNEGKDDPEDHPMKRIKHEQARTKIRSHQRKQRHREKLAYQNNDTIHSSLKDFATWSAGQPDNWNVRIICGQKCKSSPKYKISKELFNFALERLVNFRHIIFVEDMVESFNTFASSYGWELRTQTENSNTMKQNRINRNYTLAQVEQASWNPMMSALDDALYEFSKRKYNNETTESLWREFSNHHQIDEYFSSGKKEECSDICCGDCTPY
jgi:hypothetical protein